MGFAPSAADMTGSVAPAGTDAVYLPADHTAVKIVVAGPFAVGKTTLVRSVSEIRPLHTEEVMTSAGALVDDLVGAAAKSTTTVALDFGRHTLPHDLVLYLFGTPGQRRFRALWDDIAVGALGAVVLVDTRRLEDSFEAMELIEERGLPYVVAVNCFPGAPSYPVARLRQALDLHPDTPLVACDARDTTSCVDALIALVTHLIAHYAEDPA